MVCGEPTFGVRTLVITPVITFQLINVNPFAYSDRRRRKTQPKPHKTRLRLGILAWAITGTHLVSGFAFVVAADFAAALPLTGIMAWA